MKQRNEDHLDRSHLVPAAQPHREKSGSNGAGIASPMLQATANFIDQSPILGQLRQRQSGAEERPILRKALEEEEPLQGNITPVQKAEQEDDEELVQGKFSPLQRQAAEEKEAVQGRWQATPSMQRQQNRTQPNKTGLPDTLKQGIEALSGLSMDAVRVHYNSPQPAQVQAHAYAQGTDIHIAQGQEQHLAHEAWHVVQQAQGRVQPTRQLQDGTTINDAQTLEQEADEMGAKAARGNSRTEPETERTEGSTGESPAGHMHAPHLQNFSRTAQRIVVQSDWLSFDRDEKKVMTSQGSQGPWTECKDKTDTGYRVQAEKQLGDLTPFKVLSEANILPPSKEQGRAPAARSHLIAASFGGQKTYTTASENIRYHPIDLEYGAWQHLENELPEKGRRGFITARSTETITQPEHLARQLVQSIENQLDPLVAGQVYGQLLDLLKGARYVPYSVSWKYTDVEDPGLSYGQSWGNTNTILSMQPVAPGIVITALQTLGVKGVEALQGIDNSVKFSSVEEIFGILEKSKAVVKHKKSIQEIEDLIEKTFPFKYGKYVGRKAKITIGFEAIQTAAEQL